MPKNGKRRPKSERPHWGPQFDVLRSKESKGDLFILFENHVNTAVPSGSSELDVLVAIASKSIEPFQIKFLSERLRVVEYARGRTVSGQTIQEIEKILSNHPELRWWMTEDGLVVDEVAPALDSLSRFDRIVGPLSVQLAVDGALSKEAVYSIAQQLDGNGFKLKEHLQPKEWEAVVEHNRKRNGKIESFSSAAKNFSLVRYVRRSIYYARDRYNKALRLASQVR